MAGIFFDSFDHYATADIPAKWTQVDDAPTIASGGRHGTNCVHFHSALLGDRIRVTPYPAPSGATCIVGFGFCHIPAFSGAGTGTVEDGTGTQHTTLLSIRYGGVTLVWFRLVPDGTIALMKGTSQLSATTFALTQNVFQFLEFKVVLHASAGTVEIRVNGSTSPIMNLTGLALGSTVTWNEIKMGWFGAASSGSHVKVDDVYVLDGSGSYNNSFLGDTRVDVIFPNAAGNSSQFTRSAGSDQWATIDEIAPNSDTDYNETVTPTNRDMLNFPNAPVTGAAIRAVQAVAYAKKSDAGAAGLTFATRLTGTDYDGTEVPLGVAYNYVRQIWDRRPSDSGAWVDTDVNAAEFGYVKST